MPGLPRVCGCGCLVTVLVVAASSGGPFDLAQAAQGQESARHAPLPALKHSLEDRRFVGPLVVADDTQGNKDILTFKNGRFSSRICRQYGFSPAPYWVRRDSEGLHFRARMSSARSGTMRFEGVFDGKEMHATAHWIKERWYWTVEQTFRFTGHPVGRVN